ncbi:TPA: DUF2218 domain-containing protein [Pseudomonas aeruginosa]|nr:DUF2218 domain-containing protein [Pseudomonas aeruginosa]
MFRSTSHVRTESAARYVNRLCKHWGHKFEVELTPERGFIDFGDSNCELLAHPDHVLMILNSPDEDSLAHMQNVVADHLQRMANSESLEIAWQPAESWTRRHPAALRGRAPGVTRGHGKCNSFPGKAIQLAPPPSHHPLQALSRR